jgi:threonine dehydrogenase-like Zn-dependent dehydrogenase
MSCYTCENCITGNYNNCKNNAIGDKVTIPISIDNNRNSRSVQSTESDEYEMADLIAEGTILAAYIDESDSNYYLFRASLCPQVLTKDTIAMTGV